MLGWVVFLVGSAIAFESASSIDEWPDGVVDRGVQCDIWPDKVEIEMSVGMSDGTVMQALQHRLGEDAELAETVEGRLDQLRLMINDELSSSIEIQIDGEAAVLTPVRTEISARHHIRFYCYLEAPITPRVGPVELQLFDNSFQDLQNQLRIALRGRRVELERSNVPPLIVRCERVFMVDLSAADAQDARTIRGVFLDPSVEAQKPERTVEESSVEEAEEPLIEDAAIAEAAQPTAAEKSSAEPPSEFPTQFVVAFSAMVCLFVGLLLALRKRHATDS